MLAQGLTRAAVQFRRPQAAILCPFKRHSQAAALSRSADRLYQAHLSGFIPQRKYRRQAILAFGATSGMRPPARSFRTRIISFSGLSQARIMDAALMWPARALPGHARLPLEFPIA